MGGGGTRKDFEGSLTEKMVVTATVGRILIFKDERTKIFYLT